MSKVLHISPTLSLPPEAITETFAILAARGAGKSNTAAVMAEEMFDAGLPFVAVDPVGSWYGLRSSADGKGAGLPIPIFGGKRGDVPLERGGGQFVADIVVDQRLSCVLDLTGFESEGAKIQFLLGFARRLYQRNEAPLHLFLEEADDYIPQQVPKGEGAAPAMLLRAWENIVRRGRGRGLGMTMITQRSAAINKNVLTQAQTLIAMRTVGPQDVAAIEQWLKFHGQGREILASLAALESGEAWVWSPDFLRRTERVKFRRRRTFDSGATPKVAKTARPPATLADIDVSKISVAMAETIERAKLEDPAFLKKRIRELEAAAAARAPAPPKAAAAPEIRELRDQLLRLERENAALRAYSEQLFAGAALAQTLGDELADKARELRSIRWPKAPKVAAAPPVMVEPPPSVSAPAPQRAVNGSRAPADGLTKGATIVLTAIAQYGDAGVEREQLFILTGYKSTSIDTYINRLRGAGMIETSWPARATPAGLDALGPDFEPLPTGDRLLERWRGRLSGGELRVLEALVAAHPAGLAKSEIGEQTEYKSTSVDTYVTRLNARRVVEKRDGRWFANGALFG